MIKPTIIVIDEYHLHELHATFNSRFFPQGLLHRSYVHETTGAHQCRLRRNGTITEHSFCFRQILEKHWTVRESLIDLMSAYGLVRSEVLYKKFPLNAVNP
jgi:hypothetical protein